jgi:hypothetical protein
MRILSDWTESLVAGESNDCGLSGADRIFAIIGSFPVVQADSPRRRQNFWNANEIVRRGSEDEEPLDQFPPAMPGLAQAADRLHRAERLFDPLSLGHANSIAGMAGRAPIDRRAAIGVILCDVWCAAAFTTTRTVSAPSC